MVVHLNFAGKHQIAAVISQEIFRNIMSIMDQVFDLKRKGEETSDEEFERVAERVGWTSDWDVDKE